MKSSATKTTTYSRNVRQKFAYNHVGMSSKLSELKQSFSFKSLRLMEQKDSRGMRSFSDSETINDSSKMEIIKYKSKSETNLHILTEGEKDLLKSHSFAAKPEKAKIDSELKAHNEFTNSENVIHQIKSSDISTHSNSGKKDNPALILKNKNTVHDVSSSNTDGPKTSSPYPVLEDERNSASKTEHIIGEPRCLALKKNDINPFLTDDPLIFEPDFEDDLKNFDKYKNPTKKLEREFEKFVNDMFVDEDEISSIEKKGSLIDREEGELTPEAVPKSSDLNKTKEPRSTEKNATLEFFNKINECLRELNDKCREFYSSCTPDYSLAHLQQTLGNVDNIKRKLAFLIKSKNSEKEGKDKEKKVARRSHSNMRLYSERFSNSSSNITDTKSGQERLSLKNEVEELYRQLKENRERRHSESVSRHAHRREKRNRDKPSQADLLNRKKISMLEKLGTKQEIERVQSLFKRQMNLITQHVIQKKEIDKKQASRQEETKRKRRRRYSSQSQDEQESKKSRDRTSLNDLKTLEDMEAFLDSLKKDKMLCEQYINDQKSKGMLKFSSRKAKRDIPDTSTNAPATAYMKISTNPKESLKKLSNNEDIVASAQNSNKNWEGNPSKPEIKQKVDEIKVKSVKDTTSVIPSNVHYEGGINLPKKAIINNSNRDSCSNTELRENIDQIEPDISVIEVGKQRKIDRDVDPNINATGDFRKGEMKLKEHEELKPNPHKPQNISGETIQKSKQKLGDLSDKSLNKSENENEENSYKKQKVTKYIAARRFSGDNKSRYNSRDDKNNIGTAESLVKDLLSRKVVILDDNGVAVNNEFCIKVINNEVFLKKVSNKRKRKNVERTSKHRPSKKINDKTARKENIAEVKPSLDTKSIEPKLCQKSIEVELDQKQIEPEIDAVTVDNTLNEMENFLQHLRSNRKVRDNENHHPIENTSQNREMKFLARIQAKRKAKLMACVSEGIYSTEKEAKFLKALEKRDEDVSESSVETRKQAFLEKIRAEKDAISEKPKSKQNNDDPLKDVKALLNMIKEAESGNEENAKQVYVSFSLKRSDVKKLENLTTGKASSLTEESQKFLNSVRSKMKAKKNPSGISALMKKPEA